MMIKRSRMAVCGLALTLLLSGCGNVYAGTAAWQNGKRDRSEDTSRESEEAEDSREDREADNGREDRETENSRVDREADSGRETEASREAVNPRQVSFGSVPYFRDDSGSNTQLVDGWIYGYWSRQLCRVNADTLKSEVLFETESPQAGFFSIYDGMIYFLEKRGVSFPEGQRANLWRMKCDGSRQERIAEDLEMPEGIPEGIEIYDDILYLLSQSGDHAAYRYFRLKAEGGIEQISRDETLYGMLPPGWQEARLVYRYRDLPDLVYCVRNFGYAFLCDEADDLYWAIPGTGEMERIAPLCTGSVSGLVLTNRAFVYRTGNDVWYAADLDDPEQVTELGELDCYHISFWDEKGIYNINRSYGENGFSIVRLSWEGERETLDYWVSNPRLGDSVYGDYLTVLYSDGTYLYYDGLFNGDGVICRTPLERDDRGMDDGEPEQVFTYYADPVKEISTRETISSVFTAEGTGYQGSFSMTRVHLTEDTEAANKINAFLEEIYLHEEEYMAGLMDFVREEGSSDMNYWGMTLVEDELSVAVSYLDDDYIGIRLSWYQYWNGAAHGQHGNLEYVFSRSSGEKLLLTDVVENSEEEICSIIAPYVEAEAEWGTDGEGWERIILDEGRFYLTAEGIGVHFDTYELSSYASGGLDVIVPYELFTMRDPKDVGWSES